MNINSYCLIYERLEKQLESQIKALGIPVACQPLVPAERLAQRGVRVENSCGSFWLNRISPACVDCRKGSGMISYYISMKCSKSCFYCFNSNQMDYEYYRAHIRSAAQELTADYNSGKQYNHIALTGGEPLLHKADSYGFLQTARRLYPAAYTRLYTCGDHLDEECVKSLAGSGLNEIRLSIKPEEGVAALDQVLAKIELSMRYIDNVMVEMPVLPGQGAYMEGLLRRLDGMGLFGINLLELCLPFERAEDFAARGYSLKSPPYRVAYNYIYSGGLAVAGSEDECVRLLEYAADEHLTMGVHYCSLENKLTGQIYMQNALYDGGIAVMDDDFFLKSAKVFDKRPYVMALLQKEGVRYDYNPEYEYLEFPISAVQLLKGNIEFLISYQVIEMRDGVQVLRELKVERTTVDEYNKRHSGKLPG